MQSSNQAQKALFLGLSLYGISTLTSMAGMSIGVGVFLACFLFFFLRSPSNSKPEPYLENESTQRTGRPAPPQKRPFWQDDLSVYAFLSLILACGCFVSLLEARLDPIVLAGQSPKIRLVADTIKLAYLALPFVLLSALRTLSEPQRIQVLRSWLIASGVVSALALPQFFWGWPRPQKIPSWDQYHHATLFFGHHLSTASILIFPFFVALSLCASSLIKKTEAVLSLKALVSTAGFLGLGLILTWSRTLWLALPIGIIFWAARYLKRATFIRVLILTGSFVGTSITRIPALRSRVFSPIGTSDRFELWKANLDFFTIRPWTGIGWRKPIEMTAPYFQEKFGGDITSRFVGHAHNNFLEMLGGTGLLGILPWISWTLWLFVMANRASRRTDFWGEISWGFLCAWLVFQINGMTQVNLWEGKVLHQLMWAGSFMLFALPESGRTQA